MTWVMYDAVTVENIPKHAQAVAGYTSGHWPTYEELRKEFPHAHVLSIAVNDKHDAHCLDVEVGDATPPQTPEWVHRQHQRNVKRPVVYGSRDQYEDEIIPIMRAARIHRATYRIWTAHYTHVPHICSPDTCGFRFHADGTQWTDRADGKDLDESLLHSNFFPPL